MGNSKERLVMFLKYKKLSQGKFEKIAGLSNGYVNKLRRDVSASSMEKIVCAFPELNPNWLMVGEGEMLRQGNTASADHSPNAIVNAGNHVSIVGNTTNQYGDSPAESRNWSPVVPQNVASMQDTDVFEYMQTRHDGIERFYSGKANIDLWVQMQDRSLEPYIMQGDFIGIKAYPKSVYNIFQGDVYAIDTRFDGLKIRVIKNGDTPDTLLACSYNKQDYPDQVIRKEDIIRVYKKVLMFRY